MSPKLLPSLQVLLWDIPWVPFPTTPGASASYKTCFTTKPLWKTVVKMACPHYPRFPRTKKPWALILAFNPSPGSSGLFPRTKKPWAPNYCPPSKSCFETSLGCHFPQQQKQKKLNLKSANYKKNLLKSAKLKTISLWKVSKVTPSSSSDQTDKRALKPNKKKFLGPLLTRKWSNKKNLTPNSKIIKQKNKSRNKLVNLACKN